MSARRLLPALLVLLPLALLTLSRVEVIDDAYITYRYSHQLARGHGLVYNPGERVEGATNLLWTLLLALPARAGLPLDRAAVAGGLALALAALLLARALARRLGARSARAEVAFLLLAAQPRFWLVAANGLEGGLFAFLLVAAVHAAVAGRARLGGALAGLLFLTRPESAVAGLLLAAYLASSPEAAGGARERLRRALPLVLPWLALLVAATAFRLAWSGIPYPNTVAAKSLPWDDAALVARNLRDGALYALRFAAAYAPLALGSLLAVALLPRSRELWLLVAVVAAELPPVLANGGDWMPHYRLLAVYAPLLAALTALALERLGSAPRALRRAAWGALGAGALVMLARNAWRPAPALELARPGVIECYADLARRLRGVLRPGEVVAAEAVGLVGHELLEQYAHDPLGLTDAWIARHGRYRRRSGKLDELHTLDRHRPAVILVHHEEDVSLASFETLSGGRFSRDYEVFFVDPPPPCAPYGDKRMAVAVRRDALPRLLPALAGLPREPFPWARAGASPSPSPSADAGPPP